MCTARRGLGEAACLLSGGTDVRATCAGADQACARNVSPRHVSAIERRPVEPGVRRA